MTTVNTSRPFSLFSWQSYRVKGSPTVVVPLKATITLLDTKTGIENARYLEQIARRQNATTPFSGTKFRVPKLGPTDVEVLRTVPSVGYVEFNAIRGFPLTIGIPGQNVNSFEMATAKAKAKLVASLYKKLSLFNGGTFLAEISDTIRFIKRPLKAMRDELDSYHLVAKKRLRGVNRRSAKAQSIVAGTWLESQFAIKPLASDVQDAFNNLHTLSRPKTAPFRVKGWTQSHFCGVETFTPGPCTIRIGFKKKTTYREEVIYYGALSVEPPNNWSLSSWGLATENFLPSVYEAIPWSFAVDYFTNISEIVSAYSGILGRVAWAGKTTRAITILEAVNMRLDYNTFIGGIYKLLMSRVGSLGSTQITRIDVTRAGVSGSELYPDFRFQLPGLSTKWLNIAALARLRTL